LIPDVELWLMQVRGILRFWYGVPERRELKAWRRMA
jgi:hypothetical protein